MATKAELKLLAQHVKPKVRLGDQVMIIAGKDKGEKGLVTRVMPKEQRVIVVQPNDENPDRPKPLNAMVKHKKARQQNEKSARLLMAAPIHISNVMVLDPKTGEPTRVGRKKEGGKIVRYAKKSGELIPDANVMEKGS